MLHIKNRNLQANYHITGQEDASTDFKPLSGNKVGRTQRAWPGNFCCLYKQHIMLFFLATYRVAQNKWHIFCVPLNFIKY